MFASLFTAGATGLVTAVGNVIDNLHTSGEERAAGDLALFVAGTERLVATQSVHLAQTETNKIEAANPNVFVSGWRPALGWVCVAGLFYNFVIFSPLTWLMLVLAPEVPAAPAQRGTWDN